jgi:hypothetical protein
LFWPRSLGTSAIGKAGVLVAAVALIEAVAVGGIYLAERARLGREMRRSFVREGPYSDRYVYLADGLRTPATRTADRAALAESEEVIGVEVGGRARAYRLGALKDRSRHVVNDVVAGVPVSVTYCDLNECVRAFSGAPGGEPLDVAVGGMKGNRMVLAVAGRYVFQDSGEPIDTGARRAALPCGPFPAARVSWRSWREAHPDTDVYVGDSAGVPR